MHNFKKIIEDFHAQDTGYSGDGFIDSRATDPKAHRYYRFFMYLTKLLKPKTVVELGSWQGTSAAAFASGNKDTKVITVDHHTDPGDDRNKLLTLEAAQIFDNIRYCQGWTCDAIYNEEENKHLLKGENAYPKVIKELNGKKIDILFIDSWHVYQQAVRDWEAYKDLLADNALVIVDDVIKGTEGSAIDRIDKFWDELEGGSKHLDESMHVGYPMGFMQLKKK